MRAASPAESQPRLLFALPFPPRIDAPHGGRIISALILRLAERRPVAVVCIRRAGEPPVDEAIAAACAHVEEVEAPALGTPGLWRNRAAQLHKLAGAPPTVVAGAAVEGFGERLRAVAGSFRPAIVQIEPHEMAQYLPALDGLPVRRLLVDHDPGIKAAQDFSAAARGPARLLRRLDVLAWRRYARRSAARLDAIVAFTEADRAVVETYAGAVPVTVIPFTIELPPIPADPRGADPPSLLFFGGYRHPPNADAALRLQRSIFPAVRAMYPDVQLELLGGGATPEMLAAAGEGILLRGHVPELAPFLDRAALVVAPIRLGGGMRVKVLEALAAGKAVVASPRAAEGLDVEDGHELVLADTDEAFVAAVSGLLADEERRVELARAARRWAERELGEDRFVAAYEALYARLLAAP